MRRFKHRIDEPQRGVAHMNTKSLMVVLTELDTKHHGQLMVLDFFTYCFVVREVKVTLYALPKDKDCMFTQPPIAIYQLDRTGHDEWKVITIKGG